MKGDTCSRASFIRDALAQLDSRLRLAEVGNPFGQEVQRDRFFSRICTPVPGRWLINPPPIVEYFDLEHRFGLFDPGFQQSLGSNPVVKPIGGDLAEMGESPEVVSEIEWRRKGEIPGIDPFIPNS